MRAPVVPFGQIKRKITNYKIPLASVQRPLYTGFVVLFVLFIMFIRNVKIFEEQYKVKECMILSFCFKKKKKKPES